MSNFFSHCDGRPATGICCLELNAAVTLNSKYNYSEKRFKKQGSRDFIAVV